MRIVGVDPGINGAIAYWDGEELEIWDIPSVPSRNRGNEVNIAALMKIMRLLRARGVDAAFIEIPQGRPKEGAGSARKGGITYGLLVGALSMIIGAVFRVPAGEWKKVMRLKRDKNYSRTKALELFPEFGEYFERKKDHDRAEAALMAEYGRQKMRKRRGRTRLRDLKP